MSYCRHEYPSPPSLSSIFPEKSSMLYSVSIQSCCINVLDGRPAFICSCEGVQRSMSLTSSLLLQQCPACLVRLIWIVFVMSSWWLYSCCFLGCCLLDFFNIARSILVLLPSSFVFIRLVSVHVVHPHSVLFYGSGLTSIWPIAVHAFASHLLMFFLVDETLLPRYVKLSTSYIELPFSVEMSPFWLKHMYSVFSALIWRLMPTAVRSRQCSWDSAWVCICQKSYVIGVIRVRNCLAWAPTSTERARFLPAWRVMRFGQVVCVQVIVIFWWLSFYSHQ